MACGSCGARAHTATPAAAQPRRSSRLRSPVASTRAVAAAVLAVLLCAAVTPVLAGAPEYRGVEVEGNSMRVPGSCTFNDECAVGYACTPDGFCEVPGYVPFERANLMNPVGAVLLATVIGLAAGCALTCRAFLTKDITSLSETDSFNLVCTNCIALFVCLAVGVVVGLSLGGAKTTVLPEYKGSGSKCEFTHELACEPYMCDTTTARCYEGCNYDTECSVGFYCDGGKPGNSEASGQCVAGAGGRRNVPGVSTIRMDWWRTSLVTFSVVIVCWFCAAGFTGGLIEDADDESFLHALPAIIPPLCCVFIALVIGLPVGLSNKKVDFNDGAAAPTNITECKTHGVCAPYFCNIEVGQCRYGCSNDAECQPNFECASTGLCGAALSSSVVYPRMSLGGAIGLFLGLSLCCFCVMLSGGLAVLVQQIEEEGGVEVDTVAMGMCTGVVCCVIFLVTVFLPVYLSPKAVDFNAVSGQVSDGATPCTATAATVCEPYYCDTRLGTCFAGCANDEQCVFGSTCEDSQCVPDDEKLLEEPRKYSSWEVSVITVPIVLAIFVLSTCVLLRRTNVNWYGTMVMTMLAIERNKGKVMSAVCCVLVITAVGAGVTAGVVQAVPAEETFNPELASTSDANFTCFGFTSSACAPYRCLPDKRSCAKKCDHDIDCFDGALCRDRKCADAIVVGLVPTEWRNFTIWGSTAAVFFASVVFCGVFVAGANCHMRLMYGIQIERIPYTACAVLTTVLIFLLCVGLSVTRYSGLHLPDNTLKRSNVGCQSVWDAECTPYSCDMFRGECLAQCNENSECVLGTICANGECVPGPTNPTGAAAGLSYAMAFVLILLLFFGPAINRRRTDRITARRAREAEEVERVKREEEERKAKIKRDHPVFINIDPAASANDPTLLSPATWVVDPDAKPFEDALDAVAGGSGFPDALPDTKSRRPARLPSYGDAVHTGLIGSASPDPERDSDEVSSEDEVFGVVLPGRPTRNDKDKDKGKENGDRPRVGRGSISLTPTAAGGSGTTAVDNGSGVSSPPMPPSEWACPLCTFHNEPETQTCVVCLQGHNPRGGHRGADMASFLGGEGAIASAIAAARASPPTVEIPEEEESRPGFKKVTTTDELCNICFCDPSTVRFVGKNCTHGFCGDCAKRSLEAMVDSGQFPARCPGCRREDPDASEETEMPSRIPSAVVEFLARRAIVSADFAQRFIKLQILKAFDATEIISCPVCTMLNVVDPDKPRRRGRDATRVECAECETAFCGQCNCLYRGHEGLNCEAYARKQQSLDEANTSSLIQASSKPCPNCGMGICHYKGHACHHIRPGTGCPNCGIHFCIVCLERNPCSMRGHGLFCDDRCDCPPCPDCRPGAPCGNCDGTNGPCPSCAGQPPYGNLPPPGSIDPNADRNNGSSSGSGDGGRAPRVNRHDNVFGDTDSSSDLDWGLVAEMQAAIVADAAGPANVEIPDDVDLPEDILAEIRAGRMG